MLEKVYKIGNTIIKNNNYDPTDKYLKDSKIKANGENIIVKIIFDLDNDKIEFKNEKQYEDKDRKEYGYYVNPKGKQYCLVREGKEIDIFFGEMFFNFLNKLNEMNADNTNNANNNYSNLNQNIEKIINKFSLGNNKINIKKINNNLNEINEQWIKNNMNFKKNIVFFIPVIKENNIENYITQSNEYKKFYLQTRSNSNLNNTSNTSYCYLCGNKKPNIITELAFRTFGAKLSMVYQTTQINSASMIDKKNYFKNYQICEDCKNIIIEGEKFIHDNLKFTLAGIDTYIIPYFHNIISNFPYENLSKVIKTDIEELAFKGNDLEKFIRKAKKELNKDEADKIWSEINFEINFISFSYNGQSFKIVNIIQNITKTMFEKIVDEFLQIHKKILRFTDNIKYFDLSTIYRVIPIKHIKNSQTGKWEPPKGRNEVLNFYSNIFRQSKMPRNIIFEYFCELVRYFYYMKEEDFSKKEGVYKNLIRNKNFDNTIKLHIWRYLLIINALENLNIIEKKGGNFMEKDCRKCDDSEFLNEMNYNEQQRSLFFLGKLINKIGIEQYKKNHKSKPILDKIQFQGMTVSDILLLSNEVFEKLHQYQVLYKKESETYGLFRYYFDKNRDNWKLSDEENVFYLLSGYAYYDRNEKIEKESNENQNEEEEAKNE